MNKFNAIIIDDEIDNVKLLSHFLNKFCPYIDVVGEAYDIDGAITLINSTKCHIVFLDIILNDSTGFDLLNVIEYEKLKIVFVTAHDEFAIKAFKYNAVDYLLKPLNIEDVVNTTNKLVKQLSTSVDEKLTKSISNTRDNQKNLDFIAISTLDSIEFIMLDDIIYLKSDGRYTFFYLKGNRKMIASKNIGEYEKMIENINFFRIHNSYLVNLKYVKRISKRNGNYCELNSDHKDLPISKRRKNELSIFLKLK